MRQIFYNHSRRLIAQLQWDKPSYANLANDPIDHCWFHLGNTARSVTSYHDLVRVVSKIYQVKIYRNWFDVNGGLIIVGPSKLIAEVRDLIKDIVKRIENRLDIVKKNKSNKHLHLSTIKANFRSKCIQIYLSYLDEVPIRHTTYSYQLKLRQYVSQPLFRTRKCYSW